MSQSRADTLRAHFNDPNTTRRPLLTSLNGDNSWLISFPRPEAERARPSSKAYFHIVSDPWLTGYTYAGFSWILTLRTPVPAAIPSGAAVEDVVREIEAAAASADVPQAAADESSPIDAIFLNFDFGDHLDEPTLRTFDPKIPVYATPEAAAIVRRWNYFEQLTETRDFDPAAGTGWRTLHPGGGLPDWLTVFRLPGHRVLNFATAIIYSGEDGQNEALLYSPHGIRADQPALRAFLQNMKSPPPLSPPPLSPSPFSSAAVPPADASSGSNGGSNAETLHVLAILHALKDSFALGHATTLGVRGGLALARLARPRYWIRSHDAPLAYTGAMAWLVWIKDVKRSLLSGLEEEAKGGGPAAGAAESG